MPADQRLATGLLTVVAVFMVVAVVAWRPVVFALPGLVAVAALGVFDRLVVTTRDRGTQGPTPHNRDAAWYGGPPGGPARTVDPNAATTAVPRLASPTGILAAPTPTEPPPRPGAGRPGRRRPPGGATPDPAPAQDDVDMATMAIDMRAFLNP